MPTVTKYVKVGDLPDSWTRDFPNPKQMVSVTITDTANTNQKQYQPNTEQQASLDRGVEQIGRREFVSDEVMTAFRRKHDCL